MEPVGPEDAALAKVGVESSNLFARSKILRFLSNLSPAFEPGFRRFGCWGSGWGSENPEFAQATAPVELFEMAPEYASSRLVPQGYTG